MKTLVRKAKAIMDKSLNASIDASHGELKRVPNHVLALTLFLCVNVLVQGIMDIVLKLLSYSSILAPLPWRTDFLFLTAISVLMGYQTFTGLRHRKFDVTRNSIELGLLVETALIVCDSLFMFEHIYDIPHVVPMRVPFIAFTTINIGILVYIYYILRLRTWWES